MSQVQAPRLGDRARNRARQLGVRLRLIASGLERATRAALTSAGLPVTKEYLVLGCGTGDEASGLFSEVAAVIGALEHYESWRGIYAGLRVDYKNHGLYHEPATGDNWWEYYFAPIALGAAAGAAMRPVPPLQHDAFAYRTEQSLPRASAAALVRRHIRVRPFLSERVEQFWEEKLAGGRVLGVHYRGTDKVEDAPVVPYDAMATAIRAAGHPLGPGAGRLFVATDDQGFLDYAHQTFPGQVAALPMARSADGRPLHKTGGGGFAGGTDALVDCLLLSRCHQLLRTPSNLGLCATLFNPTLPVTVIERG